MSRYIRQYMQLHRQGNYDPVLLVCVDDQAWFQMFETHLSCICPKKLYINKPIVSPLAGPTCRGPDLYNLGTGFIKGLILTGNIEEERTQ